MFPNMNSMAAILLGNDPSLTPDEIQRILYRQSQVDPMMSGVGPRMNPMRSGGLPLPAPQRQGYFAGLESLLGGNVPNVPSNVPNVPSNVPSGSGGGMFPAMPSGQSLVPGMFPPSPNRQAGNPNVMPGRPAPTPQSMRAPAGQYGGAPTGAPTMAAPDMLDPNRSEYQYRMDEMVKSGQFNPLALQFMRENENILNQVYREHGGDAVAKMIRDLSPAYQSEPGPVTGQGRSIDPTPADKLYDEIMKGSRRRLDKTLSRGRGRTFGFNGNSQLRPSTEQRIRDVEEMRQLDAAAAIQGRLPTSNPSGPAPDGGFGPRPSSQYDPDEAMARRDELYDRWTNEQFDFGDGYTGGYGKAGPRGNRNVLTKETRRYPDANGVMRDMPALRIRSAREAAADRLEQKMNAGTATPEQIARLQEIRKTQRGGQQLSHANAQIRELRRKARALGMETEHYQYLPDNATPEQIRQAMDQGKQYEAVLDNARKDGLRNTQQKRAEAVAQGEFMNRLGRMPLKAQMEFFGQMSTMQMARERMASELEQTKERGKQADRDTRISAAVAMMQSGIPSLVQQGQSILSKEIEGLGATEPAQGGNRFQGNPGDAAQALATGMAPGGEMQTTLGGLGLLTPDEQGNVTPPSPRKVAEEVIKRIESGNPPSPQTMASIAAYIQATGETNPQTIIAPDPKMPGKNVTLADAYATEISKGTPPNEALEKAKATIKSIEDQKKRNVRTQDQNSQIPGNPVYYGNVGGYTPY